MKVRRKSEFTEAEQWWPGKEVVGVEYPIPEGFYFAHRPHDKMPPNVGAYGLVRSQGSSIPSYILPGDWMVFRDGYSYIERQEVFEKGWEAEPTDPIIGKNKIVAVQADERSN